MLISAQIRAARGLLGWPTWLLAEKAGVHITTVQRLERLERPLRQNARTVQCIQQTFVTAGVKFTEKHGQGVQLQK